MKLIIAGSRDYNNYEVIKRTIDHTLKKEGVPLEGLIVFSGGAKGVDKCGEWWAKERGVPVERFPADWELYGKAAGPIRNEMMAEEADMLIAFRKNKSPGTTDMIKRAKQHGLVVVSYRV